jgi:hypothetical protein
MLTRDELAAERAAFIRRHAARLSQILGRPVDAPTRLRPIEVRATRACRSCGNEFVRERGSNTPYCQRCKGKRRDSERALERKRLRQRCYWTGEELPPIERECVACDRTFAEPIRKGRPHDRCPDCRSQT